MTIKEMVMIKNALCGSFNCEGCLLYNVSDCNNIHELDKVLTPEKEKELMDWYHKNVNTYINDFCKKHPFADREYVVNNVCLDMVYNGCECSDCEGTVNGCVAHWNSIMEND